MNKTLMIISLVFISLLAVSAVSAADNVSDVVEVSNAEDSNVVAVDSEDEIVSTDVADEVVAVDSEDEVVGADVAEKEDVISKDSKSEDSLKIGSSGNGSSFDFSKMFNGTSIDLGNGTKFNLSDLLNGTTLSFGNGTSINISDLLNGNFSFGNGTSFNISSLLNSSTFGNGTFDFSSIINMFGGSKETIEAADLTKVYTANTKYSVTVKKGNETLTSGTVIFTIDNKEVTGHIGSNGVATASLKNLKPGTHFVVVEYGDVLVKKVITVKKATPKLTAKNKAFKKAKKTKKYAVTLKTNEGKALKNTKVTIKVKGKTYKAQTNSKGKATFKITKLNKKGKFKAVVKSKKTDCYNSVSKKVKITVK